MAGRGKKKRIGADEAENRVGPGLEQPLEEEKTEKKINKNKKDKKYRKKMKFASNICETFCKQPKVINEFKIFLEKFRKSIEKSSKFKLEEYEAKCGEPSITKKLKAKYKKRIEKSSKNDGIDKLWELLDEDTFHTLCELEMQTRDLAGIGTPFEPPIRGREEELPEAQGGKMPASADDYTPPHCPIGGSHPIGFVDVMDAYVAKCPSSHGPDKTPLQQPDVLSRTAVMPGIGSQVDPESLGFDCKKLPPHESCSIEFLISKMLEMQEGFRQMEDNMDTKIQKSVVAALAQLGFCQQPNAPNVSPAGPHHNSHNEENDGTNEFLCEGCFLTLSDPGPETQTGDWTGIPALHGLHN